MNKIGFVVKVKAKNKEYFYLRRSFWEDKQPKNKNVFSFGNREKAISNLSLWKENIEMLPGELKEMGYNLEDVNKWLEEIKDK
jgi:hypothetical protein